MPQESDIRSAVRAMFGRRKREDKRPAPAAMPEYHPTHPYDESQSPRKRITPKRRGVPKRAPKRRG